MEVTLPSDLEQRIADKVNAGRYTSASEMVQEGLRLLFEAEDSRPHRLAALDADIRQGLNQLDRGLGIPGASVLADVDALLGARHRA